MWKHLVNMFSGLVEAFKTAPWYIWPQLLIKAIFIFLIVIPVFYLIGFILGCINVENPHETAVELIGLAM